MAAQTHRTIGIFSPLFNGSYFGAILSGLRTSAVEHELTPLVLAMTAPEAAATHICADAIDGWVSIAMTEGLDSLANVSPVVVISAEAPNCSSILIENTAPFQRLVEHLIDQGHRRIAFVGWLAISDPRERLQGYCAALAAHGIPYNEALVVDPGNSFPRGGAFAAEQLHAAGIEFSAVALANDYSALGFIERIRALGRRVPEDVAVVGFDDIPDARTHNPQLTTARIRFNIMGEQAVDLLAHLMDSPGAQPTAIRVQATPIFRGSSGAIEQTGITFQPPRDGASWREQLSHALADIITYPAPRPPDEPPEHTWPEVHTMVNLLDEALQEHGSVDRQRLEALWRSAIERATYADLLSRTLETTAAFAVEQLAATPIGHPRRAAVAEALSALRVALINVLIAREFEERGRRNRLVSMMLRTNQLLAQATIDDVLSLAWLEPLNFSLVILALWQDLSHTTLRIYALNAGDIASHMTASAFPGRSLPPTGPNEMTFVVPVKTLKKNWGVLLMRERDRDVTVGDDNPLVWAGLLGERLDALAMTEALEQRNETMELALRRERELAETIRELGCPVIPLADDVILIPLIGLVDHQRAQQIIETTLAAVEQVRAREVLLDITGVPLIDTHVAGILLQLAAMVQLLGAQVRLAGVRPEIAQSIIGLGLDLRQIRSYPSVAEALQSINANR